MSDPGRTGGGLLPLRPYGWWAADRVPSTDPRPDLVGRLLGVRDRGPPITSANRVNEKCPGEGPPPPLRGPRTPVRVSLPRGSPLGGGGSQWGRRPCPWSCCRKGLYHHPPSPPAESGVGEPVAVEGYDSGSRQGEDRRTGPWVLRRRGSHVGSDPTPTSPTGPGGGPVRPDPQVIRCTTSLSGGATGPTVLHPPRTGGSGTAGGPPTSVD